MHNPWSTLRVLPLYKITLKVVKAGRTKREAAKGRCRGSADVDLQRHVLGRAAHAAATGQRQRQTANGQQAGRRRPKPR